MPGTPVLDARAPDLPVLLAGAEPVDAFLPPVLLRPGACGGAVRVWQRWLEAAREALGTPAVAVDGLVGPDTRRRAYELLAAAGVTSMPAEPDATLGPCDGGSPSGGTASGRSIVGLALANPWVTVVAGVAVVALVRRPR